MSSTFNKLTQKISNKVEQMSNKDQTTNTSNSTSSTYNNPHSTNAGPHSSNAANKFDPRIDSDRDGRNDPTSRVGGYGRDQTGYENRSAIGTGVSDNYASNNTGLSHNHPHTNTAHSNPIANKLDPRVDTSRVGGYENTSNTYGNNPTTGAGGLTSNNHTSTHTNPTHNNVQSTNLGPHSSSVANKLDPRVDSDGDGRSDLTSRVGGHGHTQNTHDNHSTAGTGILGSNTTNLTHNTRSTGLGHNNTHSSGLGHNNTHSTSLGHNNTHSTGLTHNNTHATNLGPHSSSVANKLDPRVDSDGDRRNNPDSRVGGIGQTQNTFDNSTTTGAGHLGTSNTYGSNNSGLTHNNTGLAHNNTGLAHNNTGLVHNNTHSTNIGPHSSSVANKLDPRVDSDGDGRNNPASRVGGLGHTQHHDGLSNTSGLGGVSSTDASFGNTYNSNAMNTGAIGHNTHHVGSELGSSHVGPGHNTGSHIGASHNTSDHLGTGHHTLSPTSIHARTTYGPGEAGYSSAQYDNPQSTRTAGPHKSDLLNKLDPRVDSDRDGRNALGSTTGTGTTQVHGSNTHGLQTTTHTSTHTTTHSSHGGLNNRHNGSSTTYDNTPTTTTPHKSNLLNKLDPRVDTTNTTTGVNNGQGTTQAGRYY